MTVSGRPALGSTIHEPEYRLHDYIEGCADLVKECFSSVTLSATPATNSDLLAFIRSKGIEVVAGAMARTTTYRRAIEGALAGGPPVVFSCDFDRLLHWASAYPEELAETVRKVMGYDFTLIGRTERAFGTHPATQRKTEVIGNLVCSRLLGFERTIDVISATWAARPRVLERILAESSDDDYGLYTEWPMLGLTFADGRTVIEVEGLEWETPDRFAEEIERIGHEQWLARFETTEEWALRAGLAHRAIEVVLDRAAREGRLAFLRENPPSR